MRSCKVVTRDISNPATIEFENKTTWGSNPAQGLEGRFNASHRKCGIRYVIVSIIYECKAGLYKYDSIGHKGCWFICAIDFFQVTNVSIKVLW
jgi:hypothetical protein